ncbi:MAG: glycosyltransferase [Elusimicrobia bacterium]|nr:glycosyltransferase [Elusimicrobiota bacterium]
MTAVLTLMCPALNEAESLKTFLPKIKSELDRLGVPWEILVVDGGSSDGTAQAARAAGCRVVAQKNPGFGGAVKDGIAEARGEYILEMDADGSHPPEMIPTLWEARSKADLVIASRYVAGGSAQMSALRYGLSWLLNKVTRFWLAWPVLDASSGLRIYRAAAVKPLPLSASDFVVQQEALALILRAGGSAAEVPFRYGERVGGRSKARVLPLAVSYLKMLWRLKRL